MKWTWLPAAVLFAVAYSQPWTLYSNQHQYFLHAAAMNGQGDLAADWLANTKDPTPLFSHALSFGLRIAGDAFHVSVMFLFLVLYALSFRSLLEGLKLGPVTAQGEWLWAALFTASHAAFVRYASDRLCGADYPWFLQCGFANQYLLGPGLQPSVFGVFLVAALAAFVHGRGWLGVGLTLWACVWHATYVLPAAMLLAGWFAFQPWKAHLKQQLVAVVGLFAIGGAALLQFAPTNPDSFRSAQTILAEVRIPHHARPQRWFDVMGGFQILWLLFGLAALRRTTLALPYALIMVFIGVGTGLVLATAHPTLALAFPWRISAVLIPLATAVLCLRVVRRLETYPRATIAAMVILLVCNVGGTVAVYTLKLGYREPPSEDPVLEFVRSTAKPGDVYLIPARFPKPNPPAGVYSATFSRPPGEHAIVYFELARFRLVTGAAIYVDFKSIPYQDVELLEWHRRVSNCVQWFGQKEWPLETVDAIRKEGITHVVAPAAKPIVSPRVVPIHTAGVYVVYRVLSK